MNLTINQFIIQKALRLPRIAKRVIAILLDSIICILATWVALSVRFGELIIFNWQYAIPALVSISIAIPVFFIFGFYKVIYRYITGDIVVVMLKAITIYTLIYSIIFIIVTVPGIPRSNGLTQPMVMLLLVSASRWLIIIWLKNKVTEYFPKDKKKGIIIYGVGNAGRQLAVNLTHNYEYKLIFFIDDNKNFWGGTIDGYPVKAPSTIINLTNLNKENELWLAIPSLSGLERKRILKYLKELPLYVRTLPSFSDLTNGKVQVSDVRELNINELLGRDPIKPDRVLFQKCIYDKTILVTGAGGSIGSELCYQILGNKPKYILLLENSELALYNIHSKLNLLIIEKHKNQDDKSLNNPILISLLVNVQDKNQLESIFKTWKPHTVYHAAAYKHVPMVEHNVVAGIRNNVIGTSNCANLSIKYKVNHFVLISTDKAVRPTNIMGASKRLAEMIIQILSNDKNNNSTLFSIVRFGNVLGSSGSVVPLFRKQIQAGGPITLTHEDVTRYFMTTTEAAQLVIQAGALSQGGEVFLLDMGQPVNIIDLARNMIESSGFRVKDEKTPWGDIEIKVIGLRPGEKLYEELLIGNNPQKTKHERIHQAYEKFIIKQDFDKIMEELNVYLKQNNVTEIRQLLKKNVSGYLPSGEDVDWISKFKKNNL